jgi:hypothetical protein
MGRIVTSGGVPRSVIPAPLQSIRGCSCRQITKDLQVLHRIARQAAVAAYW